jgi:pyridoxine 5-phosphate synthase
MKALRLGVNIDHVATIRNSRGGHHPDPVRAALMAVEAGADGITVHLREDRRHILDDDITRLMDELSIPLNLEMAATEEMQLIALKHQPHACCLVPERRAELTTEGGLDVVSQHNWLMDFVASLREGGMRVSLFIDPEPAQIEASHEVKSNVVELHTGTYCKAVLEGNAEEVEIELQRLVEGARLAASLGLEVHAGHGLTFDSVGAVAAIPEIVELNIGHFIVGEAIFTSFDSAVARMKTLMERARSEAGGSGE